MTIRSTGDARADTLERHVHELETEAYELVGVIRRLEAERDQLMADMWLAYVLSGADTDGATRWHCTPRQAGISLIDAVRQLRDDYDEALAEK